MSDFCVCRKGTLSPSYRDPGMSEDSMYRRVTPGKHKDKRFGNSLLVVLLFDLCFLMMNLTSLELC